MASSASLYITQIRFCRALAVVRSLPTSTNGAFKPSIAERLNFYGLYKQAVSGDCQLLRPSSRLAVQYAKWKSWDKLRGTSPIEAQAMYIHALIELLTEFLNKYPESYLTESINESLVYLQESEQDPVADDSLEDAFSENDKEQYYLGQIEEQLLSDYSYISSPVTSEFPLTPELSPRPPTNTLIATAKSSPSHHLYYYNKQHKKHPTTSSSSSSSHYHNSLRKNNSSHHGNDDDDDDFDKEVATATSSLSLSSPNDHPYQVNVALQSLHEEVNSLYNELTHLNDGKPSILKRVLGFKWMWLFKSIAKHVFFNFIVMLLLFFVLWRRKSPIAYAVLSYSGPKLQALMRFLFNRVVYWKVTV